MLTVAIFSTVSLQLLLRKDGAPFPPIWSAMRFAVEITPNVASYLLLPSGLGFGLCWLLLRRSRANAAKRAAWQGAAAGLGAVLGFMILTEGRLLPPTLIALPVGAFFGWLIYCKLWPHPAAM